MMGAGDVFGLVALLTGIVGTLAILAGVHNRRLAFAQRKLEIMGSRAAEQAAEQAARHAAHTGELEARLRVLERIVTDGGYEVATRIEALRNSRTGTVAPGAERTYS